MKFSDSHLIRIGSATSATAPTYKAGATTQPLPATSAVATCGPVPAIGAKGRLYPIALPEDRVEAGNNSTSSTTVVTEHSA